MRKTTIQGKSPNIFVGHSNYPRVDVGYLLTQKYDHHDDPKFFAKNKFSIPKIITKRRQLLNSKIKARIYDPNNKLLESAKLIAKSSRPVESEITLTNMKGSFSTDDIVMPFGPSAQLNKIELTEHVKIQKPIQKITDDTDVLAKTGLLELNKNKIDEYHLTKLLSIGTLGIQRKLVPTKWSITAVDDILGIHNQTLALDYQETNFEIYTGEYLGNKYIICFFPGPYSYEFIEIIYPFTKHNPTKDFKLESDFEYTQGRTKYAFETAGGYYASKLPIIEFLNNKKRQGRIVVFRCITDDYTTPLGVWVVREGIRETLKHRVKDIDEKDAKKVINYFLKKYKMQEPENAIKHSRLLKEKQKSLMNFNPKH